MSGRRIPLLRTLAWLVPALVLATSGAMKVVAPRGSAPEAWAGLERSGAYPWVLRGVGVLELVLVALLFLPKTRRAGCFLTFAILAMFSGVVAFFAHDTGFVQNCGCFGSLKWPGLSGMEGGYAGILVRNAVLAGLVAAAALLAAPAEGPRREAWAQAGICTALLLLASLFLAERSVRTAREATTRADAEGRSRLGATGWALPAVPVTTADGAESTLDREVRPRDTLVFFEQSCPFSRRASVGWGDWARRLERDGTRLLLVGIDPEEDVAAFVRTLGAPLAHVVLGRRDDARRLGIRAVPSLLALDDERKVAFHELGTSPSGLLSSLELLEARAPGVERATFGVVAAALFGEGAARVGELRASGDARVADVRAGDRALGRLVLVRAPEGGAHALEVAVALDDAGRLRGVLSLQDGGYAARLDPRLAFADALRGLSLAEARARLEELVQGTSPERPLAIALLHALERVPE